MGVTEERFRALARSSPWRWSSLQFVRTRRHGRDQFGADVRAWLRRPDALRVEDLEGHLLHTEIGSVPRTVALFTPDGGRELPLRPASSVAPALRPDGLVRRRPSDGDLDYDDPMFQDYAWVAMLDPVELADGDGGRPGATLEHLRSVEHHGREAWEAIIRPTSAYAPRCSCCALLLSEVSERRLAEEGGPAVRAQEPSFEFADAHLVRLDLESAVCVYLEQLGGDRSGWADDVCIEQMDEPMPDVLFSEPQPH
ncbi:hypothetical protein [Egicoccus sp. AB-alg6-2]|uniref:hypothetical protein n=1 Tax=Egicoccus sp. AB-alg6-2 TaxID=3242692 RepID=UPI00359DD432